MKGILKEKDKAMSENEDMHTEDGGKSGGKEES